MRKIYIKLYRDVKLDNTAASAYQTSVIPLAWGLTINPSPTQISAVWSTMTCKVWSVLPYTSPQAAFYHRVHTRLFQVKGGCVCVVIKEAFMHFALPDFSFHLQWLITLVSSEIKQEVNIYIYPVTWGN